MIRQTVSVRRLLAISKPLWRGTGHLPATERWRQSKNERFLPARTLRYIAGVPVSTNFKECVMSMGNRAVWAMLWVIGIPLPILIILYMLTGGGCNGGH
jgi:hypothetical protein